MEQANPPNDHGWSNLDVYHVQVGRICQNWAILELLVDALIWKLGRFEEQTGACVTSQIPSIHTKFRAIVALLRTYDGGTQFERELNVLNSDIRPVGEKRNRYIHDVWFFRDPQIVGQLARGIKGKDINFTASDSEISGLNDVTREIARLIERVEDVRLHIDTWLSTSPRKLHELPFGLNLSPLQTSDQD